MLTHQCHSLEVTTIQFLWCPSRHSLDRVSIYYISFKKCKGAYIIHTIFQLVLFYSAYFGPDLFAT